MIRIGRQFLFGWRVFFQHITASNVRKIALFLWKRCIRREAVPFSVVFAVTYRCQCHCVHCSVGDYPVSNNELSTQEITELIDAIDAWGPIKVTFFGGEPLLHPDIVELVAHASARGIRTALDTNGIALTEEKLSALKRAGIGNINISIDSAQAPLHDQLRQYPGCFDQALGAIRACVRSQVPTLISTYASNRSVQSRDLEAIIAMAKRERVQGVKILFPILSGRWRNNESEGLTTEGRNYLHGLVDPSYVYIEDALEMLKRNGKGCSALEKNLVYISPSGDIQPCPAIPVSFGNVRQESMLVIVKRMLTHSFYRKYRSCSSCLMNDLHFRKQYFSIKERGGLPVHVKELV